MKTEDTVYLIALANALRYEPRMGSELDSPEGARYIQLSDTFVLQMAGRLEAIAKDAIVPIMINVSTL